MTPRGTAVKESKEMLENENVNNNDTEETTTTTTTTMTTTTMTMTTTRTKKQKKESAPLKEDQKDKCNPMLLLSCAGSSPSLSSSGRAANGNSGGTCPAISQAAAAATKEGGGRTRNRTRKTSRYPCRFLLAALALWIWPSQQKQHQQEEEEEAALTCSPDSCSLKSHSSRRQRNDDATHHDSTQIATAAAAAAAAVTAAFSKGGSSSSPSSLSSSPSVGVHAVPSWVVSLLIASLGLAAASGFLLAGIRSCFREQQDQFDRAAADTVRRFRAAFQTYVNTASLVHNRCRNRNFSRREFRELYEYVTASGLAFQALQFDPRITRDERQQAEEEARAFYALHYPHVNYRGFRVVPNDTTNETYAQVEADFYYPIQYMEPVLGNEAAIALDYHSSPSRRNAVEYCLRTGQPSLTERLRLVQERQEIYGVVLFHPGVNVSTAHPPTPESESAAPLSFWPRDLASIVIRVPDLLGTAMEDHFDHSSAGSSGSSGGDLAAYLFDPSKKYERRGGGGGAEEAKFGGNGRVGDNLDPSEAEDDGPMFLGGVRVVAASDESAPDGDEGRFSSDHDPTRSRRSGERRSQHVLAFLSEARLKHVTARCRYHKVTNVSVANKVLTVVVVAAEGTFRPRGLIFVLLSSSLILVASMGLAHWNYSYTERVVRLNSIRAAAEAEKQALILDSARQAAVAERELNDFIAHEVRNPVAAAMSACSFLRHAVNSPSPLATQEDLSNAQDDVEVISNALNFVHDLLRNMLDIHRAASKDLVVHLRPTDLLRDVLEPVAAMLHQRQGSRIRLLVECPEDLHVNTDHLRLKQIVLNLGRNSTKFVDEGFIRLRAEAVAVGTEDDGDESSSGFGGSGDGNGPCRHVEISVEDSGPGIPADKRGRLFSKFQESLDTLSQGTGLGLHLCKNLTELLGGDLVLDTEYDSGLEGRPGTRFVVKLHRPPVKPAAVEEEMMLPPSSTRSEEGESHNGEAEMESGCRRNLNADQSVVESSHFRLDEEDNEDSSSSGDRLGCGARTAWRGRPASRKNNSVPLPDHLSVLFVDDDAIQRKLFSRKIKALAPLWTVREAANGETALLLAEQQEFDVIFMDQYMASVERQLLGTETVRALRSRGVVSKICGLSANDKEDEFLEAGADAFCIKPFPCESDAMKDELRRVLCL